MRTRTNLTYKEYVSKRAKKSPCIRDMLFAFLSGGSICMAGESLHTLYLYFGVREEYALLLVSLTFIFISVLLTDLGVFDTIAAQMGAGTLVPITGFANAMVSTSLDARSEGFIFGVGSKAFNVAGPVIFYGTVSSVVYGLIYWIVGMF